MLFHTGITFCLFRKASYNIYHINSKTLWIDTQGAVHQIVGLQPPPPLCSKSFAQLLTVSNVK